MVVDPPVDLGEWLKDSPLGDGGQAVVYRVYRNGDPTRKPHVAKVLKPWDARSKSATEEEQRGRFTREVLALASLASTGCPNIVPVIDKQVDPPKGTQPWYVMPFYAAGPMARTDSTQNIIYAEPYKGNVDRVLQVAESVAITLAWLHESEPQYVHRDVHTGNIFFEQLGGTPILGDFGLVHFHTDDAVKTGKREPFGPWQWRPPELSPGSDDKKNPASDVYMLGGVIYEALSGGEYIEETEQVGGQFTHEQPEYNLNRFTDDPRIKHVTNLLRNMLARDPRARMTARQVVTACRSIREWRSSEPNPVQLPASLILQQAAANYRNSGYAYRTQVIQDHLFKKCAAAVQGIQVSDRYEPYQFQRGISLVSNNAEPATGVAIRHPGAAWAGVGVAVAYQPTPSIRLASYLLLVRTEQNQEIVALFNEKSAWKELSKSVPDDPGHDELIRRTVLTELERLAAEGAQQLNVVLEQEKVEAQFRSVRIQGVTCSYDAHRLLRHLIQAMNTQVTGWVEIADALKSLDIKPEDLRTAILESDRQAWVETDPAMGPTGFSRVRIRPTTFVNLAPSVLYDVDLKAEGLRLLKCLAKVGLDSRVYAEEIEQDCEVPIPRASALLEHFKDYGLVTYAGSAPSLGSLPFGWASILVGGDSIVKGREKIETYVP